MYKDQIREIRNQLYAELKVLDARRKEMITEAEKQVADIEAQCEADGGHEDSGFMFYFVCKKCGFMAA